MSSRLDKLTMKLTAALLVGVLAGPLLDQAARAENTPGDAGPVANQTARYLAGLAPGAGSPLAAWTSDPVWRQHASSFDSAWSRLDKSQIARVRAWSARHLEQKRPTLLYMFSGPDFLYADAFFPEATTYVLAGLEPVGPVPQVTEANRRSLGRLRTALNSVLNYSFFRTISMRSDLASGGFSGTLPVLYIFMARAGKTVKEASLVRLGEGGAILPDSEGLPKGLPAGARITFADAKGIERTLYYFQVDVSNNGKHLASMLAFARSQGAADAFVKSASYLMHNDNFSQIRELLLGHAQLILQDDSGIPLKHFAPDTWELRPYGRYVGPIGLFWNRGQPKLGELFNKPKAPTIDFGVGYRYGVNQSNLLLAVRKP